MRTLKALSRLILVSLIGAGLVLAQEPPRQPVLRLEIGMHTSLIRRISVDAENRYLVTGSNDKTARVWDLATGKLLRVLRPPVGEGEEGMLYAVAISPDGNTIACGGWTGQTWDKTRSIYLFDRGSGSLLKRLTDLPNEVAHLAYSRDGKFLAAVLARGTASESTGLACSIVSRRWTRTTVTTATGRTLIQPGDW